MNVPTFTPPVAPSPGTTRKMKLKLLKADFGDGLSQVTRDGMNSMRRTLSLTWDVLTPDQAAAITGFLEGQGGADPFLYTPSDESDPVLWRCEEWEDKATAGGFRSVTATLEQSFDVFA